MYMDLCVNHDVIIQGSTPTLILHLNYDISNPMTSEEEEYKDYYDTKVVMKYGLNDYVYYTLENDLTILADIPDDDGRINDCHCQCGCSIYLTLRQEDTIKFKRQIEIQVIATNRNSGNILETLPITIAVARKLDGKR